MPVLANVDRFVYAQRPGMMQLARKLRVAEHDVEDVVQNAFLKFVANYDPQKGTSPETYIFNCLKWEVKQHFDKTRRPKSEVYRPIYGLDLTRVPAVQTEFTDVHTSLLKSSLVRTGKQLSRPQRRVLDLLIKGFSPKDIAKALDTTYGGVAQHIRRIRQVIAPILAEVE